MMVETDNTALKKLLRSNECEFVSLGYNCDVAHLLRYTGLRKKAYPFDWCITPNDSVIKIIESDFKDFIKSSNITYSEPHKALFFEGEEGSVAESDKVVVTAYCDKYGMTFPHDFTDVDMYHIVADKYNKRIDRFLKLIMGRETVVFIFKPEATDKIGVFNDRLRESLRLKCPSLKFYIYSLDEIEKVVGKSLKKSALRFFRRKLGRVNKVICRVMGW